MRGRAFMRAGVDDEDAVGIVAAQRQAGRSGGVDGHIPSQGQWTREQGDRLPGQGRGERHRPVTTNAVQGHAQGAGTAIRRAADGHFVRAAHPYLVEQHRLGQAVGDNEAHGVDLCQVERQAVFILESREGQADLLPA